MAKKKVLKTTPVKKPKKATALVTKPIANSAEALIAQAISSGASVDTMERLLAMRRELKEENAREEFNFSMAAFQSECPIIKKTKTVKTKAGDNAYSYAPIESVIRQVKTLIQKHGFRYSTSMELKDKGVKAVCRVVHSKGHSEETPMEVPFGNKTNIMSESQVAASAQTFAKRYAFQNAFGIMTGDEDDDAKSVGDAEKGNAKLKKIATMIAQMTGKQLTEFRDKMEKSDKYTKGEKKLLLDAADYRINELMESEAAKV